MEIKTNFKATVIDVDDKDWEQVQREVKEFNEAKIKEYLDSLEPEETE